MEYRIDEREFMEILKKHVQERLKGMKAKRIEVTLDIESNPKIITRSVFLKVRFE